MKKVLFTLQVGGYGEDMSKLTIPFMQYHADKIGAEFRVIKERRWPELPPVMEKFQIYHLAQEEFKGYDWFIYWDLDTLIHPDFFDVTALLGKDTTCSGITSDFTPNRFKPDPYFLRDGRFIGKGNWCAMFSDWCLDYYHPPEPMTAEHVEHLAQNIRLTVVESRSGVMQPSHLIDDYCVSRNIARYGLKHTLISEIASKFNRPDIPNMLFHQYLHDMDKKIVMMQKQLEPPTQTNQNGWGIKIESLNGNGEVAA